MNPFHRFSFSPFLLISIFSFACSSNEGNPSSPSVNKIYQKGEYIYRNHNESLFNIPEAKAQSLDDPYPWEKGQIGSYPKITKEFFRCKGSTLNPMRATQEKGELARYFDCGGAEKHSLPLRNEKEFIYPILLELVNYIQIKTQKRVVITSGYRCPEHNLYVDSSLSNRYSKHTLGAEVSFYVQGLELHPEVVIQHIQEYYKTIPKYQGKKDYLEFLRYEKDDLNISTLPWYNKEVFVKIYKPKEGRNFDNRHPYPYLSIQVRFDYDLQEKVVYSWDKANQNYHRH